MKFVLTFLFTIFLPFCGVFASAHATPAGDMLRKHAEFAKNFDAVPYAYKDRIAHDIALLNSVSAAVNQLMAAKKTPEDAEDTDHIVGFTLLAYNRMAENEFLLGNWRRYMHYCMRTARLVGSLERGVPSILALGVQAARPAVVEPEDYAWFFFEGEEFSDPMELVRLVTRFIVTIPSSDPLRLHYLRTAYKMRSIILDAITYRDMAVEDDLMTTRIERAIKEGRTLSAIDVMPGRELESVFTNSRFALISKAAAQDPGLPWRLTRWDFFTHSSKLPPKVMIFLLITAIDALHLKNNHIIWSDSADALEIAYLYAGLAWTYKMAGHPEFFMRCFTEKYLRIVRAYSNGVRVKYDFLWPDEFLTGR